MKKYFLILLPILLIICFIGCAKNSSEGKNILSIGNKKINIEIADSSEKRAQGLSGRKTLEKNSGMLFIFDKSNYYNFHMQNMNFPLDFIWINNDEIVEIIPNVSASSHQPPDYLRPSIPVDKVLEVNAGFSSENNIKVGDTIIIK